MKEEYLNQLRVALERENVKNIDTIIDTYRSRFDLGHEAEMSDEEIISMLGPVEAIVEKYMDENDEKEEKNFYDLDLCLKYFSDFSIERTNQSGVRFEIDEEASEYIDIKKDGRKITLKDKHRYSPMKKYPKFNGTLFIGKDVVFNSFSIGATSGDLEVCPIQCENITIAVASGDLHFDSVTCGNGMEIANTSADIVIDVLISKEFKINTISGDIKIDDLCCDIVSIATVSGDVVIKRSNDATYDISSVSGDVKIKSGVDVNKVSSTSISGEIEISGIAVKGNIESKIKDMMSKIKIL